MPYIIPSLAARFPLGLLTPDVVLRKKTRCNGRRETVVWMKTKTRRTMNPWSEEKIMEAVVLPIAYGVNAPTVEVKPAMKTIRNYPGTTNM